MNDFPDVYTILGSWPMIIEDFEMFTKDPTCWFIGQFEKAVSDKDWTAITKLIDIFKVVNSPSETHSH